MKQDYVQLDTVKSVLEEVINDKSAVEEVLKKLSEATVAITETKDNTTEEQETTSDQEGEETPKVKKQYGILVCDKDGQIQNDMVGWVFQMPEDEDIRTVVKHVKTAAYNYNASKKGRKYPVSSIGQAIDTIGSKYLKPYNINVKTKEPVLVVTTDNILPKS